MKILTWVLGLVVGAGVLIAGASYVAYSLGKGAVEGIAPNPTVTVTTKDERSVQSIVREQQVVLVGLDIQGIQPAKSATKWWGIEVPGSSRASFTDGDATPMPSPDGSTSRGYQSRHQSS